MDKYSPLPSSGRQFYVAFQRVPSESISQLSIVVGSSIINSSLAFLLLLFLVFLSVPWDKLLMCKLLQALLSRGNQYSLFYMTLHTGFIVTKHNLKYSSKQNVFSLYRILLRYPSISEALPKCLNP